MLPSLPANFRRLRHSCRQSGVSLIEVIVALVIISGFGAALFVWAGQTLQTSNRAKSVLEEVEIESNITEVCKNINPADQTTGVTATALMEYRWTAQVLRESLDHVRHPFGISPFQIGLFQVQITVTNKLTGKVLHVGNRIVAGSKQVRVRPGPPPGFAEAGAP